MEELNHGGPEPHGGVDQHGGLMPLGGVEPLRPTASGTPISVNATRGKAQLDRQQFSTYVISNKFNRRARRKLNVSKAMNIWINQRTCLVNIEIFTFISLYHKIS